MSNYHKILFIGGLHRSGTSILSSMISSSKNVSAFNNTSVPENEGQHLQTIYKPAHEHGGPGKFAFDETAILTEKSHLINKKNKKTIFQEWSSYWDLSKEILLEKSPPNMIRTRFLQSLFPNTYFVTIIRHPLFVSFATQKWTRAPIENLLEHWICAHKIYFHDKSHLKKSITICYEELIKSPGKVLQLIDSFLGTEIEYENQFVDNNIRYLDMWNSNYISVADKNGLVKKYEKKLNDFGYSLLDFNLCPDFND
ncbi:sulfotransferase [Snuella lapsa]|uniref:Sulfotransferase n=1 Tax=Snuella lapsa TaxID=870481 RepID=A0ABP6XAZ0_9FLAO